MTRIIQPEEHELGIYTEGENALDRIQMWKSAEGTWWAVVRTALPDGEQYTVGEVAFAVDKSERPDTAVIKWADRMLERARHPEEELEEA